jgi:hypothetical protein
VDAPRPKRRLPEVGEGLSLPVAWLLYELHGVAHDVASAEAMTRNLQASAASRLAAGGVDDGTDDLGSLGSLSDNDDDDDEDGGGSGGGKTSAADGIMLGDARHTGAADVGSEDVHSSLSLLLPRALVSLLRKRGPEGFAAVFNRDQCSEPEVMWGASMRFRLMAQLRARYAPLAAWVNGDLEVCGVAPASAGHGRDKDRGAGGGGKGELGSDDCHCCSCVKPSTCPPPLQAHARTYTCCHRNPRLHPHSAPLSHADPYM